MSDRRSHPIFQVLNYAAMGDVPTPGDLERIGVTGKLADDLTAEARAVAALHGDGAYGLARKRASESFDMFREQAEQAGWEPPPPPPAVDLTGLTEAEAIAKLTSLIPRRW